MARSALCRFVSSLAVLALASLAGAAPPSEKILPAATKAFVSTQDVDQVRTKFQETQLGQLVHDPIMKPFIDDLKEQIGAKLEKAGKRMGLKWDDLDGVSGGEVALALVQPDAKDKLSHATVLFVDITGKRMQADALLAKVDANQKKNKSVRSSLKAGPIEMVVYTHPLAAGATKPEVAYYFIQDDVLVATDHEQIARDMAGRFGAEAKGNLASLEAFQAAMKRNKDAAAGMAQHIRWFVEPFGYAEVSRAMNGGKRRRGTDMLKILKEQGFTAIQGIGGYVFFSTGQEDILHRTYIYAPAVVRKPDDKSKDKYNLAMRMLNFPNSVQPTDLDPQPWVLPDVASYLTFNCKVRDAFEFSSTLVDAIAGDEGVFNDIWAGLETDPNGQKINIRKELIDHLGERITLLSDVKVPIDLKSERLLALIDVKRPDIVAKTLKKAFEKDPSAKKRVIGGQVIWELLSEEGIAASPELMIEGAGFVKKEEPDEEEEEVKDRVLPNMAMTVFDGHLIVSTHVDFIVEFIERQGKFKPLAATPEFVRVNTVLKTLGSDLDSFRFFTRTDEAYRATYELVKQNKLPQSETLLARLLNAALGPKEGGVVRKQSIDGSKLPPYEAVMKYFGPGGLYVHSERDGWFVVGCLLKKEAK